MNETALNGHFKISFLCSMQVTFSEQILHERAVVWGHVYNQS